MTKTEWQEFKLQLDQAYSDFHFAYQEAKNGSNQKKRDAGSRKADFVKARIRGLINKNNDTYALLVGDPPAEGFGLAILLDDFYTLRYLEGNLAGYISKVDQKIAALD